MQLINLKVVRNTPRSRETYNDLCGNLDASVIVEEDKLSFLHIGAGKESFDINLNELRKEYEKAQNINEFILEKIKFTKSYDKFVSTSQGVVIPGSSIKGNIRSRLELSFKGYKDTIDSCFIIAGKPLFRELIKGVSGWRHYRIWRETLFENRGLPCNFNSMGKVCIICDLFGTAGLKSLIDFSDFVAVNPNIEYIDLPFGKVEVVPAGTEFKGKIHFKNLRDYELGLLLLGMGIKDSRLGRKVILGKFKYKSKIDSFKFGRVKFSLNELKLSGYSQALSVQDIFLGSNSSLRDDPLDGLCKTLTDLALKKFENKFRIVDEVRILDEL